jgi:hypothetical protein
MKTFVKIFVVVLFTFGMIVAAVSQNHNMNAPIVKTGVSDKFTVDANHFFMIDVPEATLTASSSDQFMLTHAGVDSIVPKAQTPPIDVTSDTYYKVEPVMVQGGKWNVELGSPTVIVTVTGNQPVTVRIIPTESYASTNTGLIDFLGVVLWILVMCLIAALRFFEW